MNNTEFKIGDKIYHASNSSVYWIIEKIENNEAFCSTLIKETLEQKKEKFTLTSIKKYKTPSIRVSGPRTRNTRF